MPFELSEGTLSNDEVSFDEDANGNLVMTHESSGATFKYNSSNNQWVMADPVKTPVSKHSTDISENYTVDSGEGAVFAGPITGSGSISGNGQVSVIQEGTTFTDNVDAQGNDINNLGSLEADEQSINEVTARAYPQNDFSVSSTTITTVPIGVVDTDDNIYNVDLNNDEISVNNSGVYLISAKVDWAGSSDWSAGDKIQTRIVVNGGDKATVRDQHVGLNKTETQQTTAVLRLNVNDSILFDCFHDNGTTETVNGGNDALTTISVSRLG